MSFLTSYPPGGAPCLICMRRILNGFNNAWLSSAGHQIRGKKKLTKATTIKVRLLEDIPRYGRKGSIIPIPPGRMRNDFYLKKKAEYMTKAQLHNTGLRSSEMHRDSTFGSSKQQSAQDPIPVPRPAAIRIHIPIVPSAIEVDLIKPERAMKIVSKLIPQNIDFYRVPIASTPPSPHRQSPSIPESSAISTAAQDAAREKKLQESGIYGSVTPTEVAETIKAILVEDSEGSRVVLTQDDIKFAIKGEESDRVKQLGVFEIDIRVKGATDPIRRTITIKAQAEE